MQWARTNLEVISTVRNSTVNGIQCWEYLSHLTIFPLGSDSLLCCCLLWKEGFHRSSCIDHAWIQVWFPMQPKEMPFHLTNQFQPDGRWFLQNTQYFLALLSALLQTETYRSLGALPAAHTRCCPLYFVSCFAFPWDISGESVAHRAVLDSRVLAVALPEVPAAVCRGCFLHTAEASSSPSDPLGLKAAKQIVTHDIHPAAYRNCSQLQKKKTEENFTRLMQSSKSHLPLCGCCNPQFCSEVQHGFQRPFKQQTFHKEQAQWEAVILRWHISYGQRRGKKVGRAIKKDELSM